jgi:putative Mg2+ transporter-C (MgtC) family protein
MTEIIWEELFSDITDTRMLVRIFIRLLLAMLFGAVVGFQRERTGKAAGLRTHTLVSSGAALFVLAPIEAGMGLDGLARVIQGLATGIGFLGAGAILKLHEQREIVGLTTAADIWMTAAIGVAVGLGRIPLALMSVILTLIILTLFSRIESRINEGHHHQERH